MAVNYRETLITYLHSDTSREAAKTLGISYPTLMGRIKVLRKAGVTVPVKRNHASALTKLEISQLNSLVRKFEKEAAQAK